MSGVARKTMRLLVLNPNSSTEMTHVMETAVQTLEIHDSVEVQYYTAASPAPSSINNGHDIEAADAVVRGDSSLCNAVERGQYDAILVACFSVQTHLASYLAAQAGSPAVTGIFEAGLLSALSLGSARGATEQWGIVTTGQFWEDHLSNGVKDFLGQERPSSNARFVGVFSTGLDAGDLHTAPPDEVERRLTAATERLLGSGRVGCVVMGCAGMAGLEDIIRSAATKAYGSDAADRLYIIDGVRAGILQLEQIVQSRRAFANSKD